METMTIVATPTWVEPTTGLVMAPVCALGVAYLGCFQGTGVSAADHGKRRVADGTFVSRIPSPILDVAPTLGRPPV